MSSAAYIPQITYSREVKPTYPDIKVEGKTVINQDDYRGFIQDFGQGFAIWFAAMSRSSKRGIISEPGYVPTLQVSQDGQTEMVLTKSNAVLGQTNGFASQMHKITIFRNEFRDVVQAPGQPAPVLRRQAVTAFVASMKFMALPQNPVQGRCHVLDNQSNLIAGFNPNSFFFARLTLPLQGDHLTPDLILRSYFNNHPAQLNARTEILGRDQRTVAVTSDDFHGSVKTFMSGMFAPLYNVQSLGPSNGAVYCGQRLISNLQTGAAVELTQREIADSFRFAGSTSP